MSYLKSAYLYFLAIQINLIKKIKKIYYTTQYYNNSLKSKTPQQIYFHPNPVLLSPLTTHKNFSFKITSIDTNMFWKEFSSIKDAENLHSFFWLNLIDRKNDGNVIQNIINVWIHKNSKYKNIVWDNMVMSRRIISWVLNADIILNNTNNSFKSEFFNSIIVQTNHLKKNIKFENNYSKKIELITATLLTGLVFKEYAENYEYAKKELERLINDFFDEEGFPINRNPNDLIKCLKFLIIIKECIHDAQVYIPSYCEEIIEKCINNLKSIITPNNQVPLFNGATEVNLKSFLEYVAGFKYGSNKKKLKIGNIQILKNKRQFIYLDIGQPPNKDFSYTYQSGPLSFEYFLDGDKIITNCGYGNNISQKAILLSRLTSAQSTLTLNDNSVVKFERNKILNSAFGYSIKNKFRISNYNFFEDDNEIKCSASHNAYEDKIGYIHKREIKIRKIDGVIFGTDELQKKKEVNNVKFNIYFHLYPGISAVETMSGSSALLHIKKNKSLIFNVKDNKMSVEKSIFLGRNKILNNICITIPGNLNKETKKINWEIKKNI